MPDNTNEVAVKLTRGGVDGITEILWRFFPGDQMDLDLPARERLIDAANEFRKAARDALAHQHQEGTGVGGAVEQRVCDDCGEEVELGSDGPWHCRMCGPRDEDETHVESVPATPEPQQEVDVEGAGRFEQLAQRFDKLREQALKAEDKFRETHPEYPGWSAGEAGAAAAFEEAAQITRELGESAPDQAEAQRDKLLTRIETLRQAGAGWKGPALQSLLDLADSMQPATSPSEQGGEVAE